LEQDGFTERVFKEARQKKLDEECEGKDSARWWATAHGYWLFCATNGQTHLDIRNVELETQWNAMLPEEREKWIAEAEEWGHHLNDRLNELREQNDEEGEDEDQDDEVVKPVALVTADSV
jgi:hypothetical protein